MPVREYGSSLNVKFKSLRGSPTAGALIQRNKESVFETFGHIIGGLGAGLDFDASLIRIPFEASV